MAEDVYSTCITATPTERQKRAEERWKQGFEEGVSNFLATTPQEKEQIKTIIRKHDAELTEDAKRWLCRLKQGIAEL